MGQVVDTWQDWYACGVFVFIYVLVGQCWWQPSAELRLRWPLEWYLLLTITFLRCRVKSGAVKSVHLPVAMPL